ncbi:TIM barrel protein [Sinorhizobium sp. BG8]|uniref:TIM barrel protein n=1 Tax=Sinorhizobium sp. BG8 TaxID=2613773 RepID=UPI00193EAECB|nr:TIM barrel protein [Sinorhizobium sp. BG8]QRM57090.1 TIM barrel protein [Sinorhizobium sp. BG8]
MIKRALNQKTARYLSYEAFLDLAQELDCVGVEPRNDLGRPLFDGLAPRRAGEMARERGLKLLGLSEVYPFNDWSAERADAIRGLIEASIESGAETFSLIPRVDGGETEDGIRQVRLREAMREILPMLDGHNVVALIEPIGFASSSLKSKAELVDAIEAVGGRRKFKMVHDTFQHAIAGGGPIFPEYTAMVHISGISDPIPRLDERLDTERILVDRDDRCATLEQITDFLAAGYEGPFSFECTSPVVQRSDTLRDDLKRSFEFIEMSLAAN